MATTGPKRVPLSSSSSTPRGTYELFLSFSGRDTRYGFTDHLYAALTREGIMVFRDDGNLEPQKHVSEELLKAIQESKLAVIVFSRNFASSKWCLNELTEMLEYRKKTGLRVLPVICHVNPSDVRNQKGFFGEAFAGYREDQEIDEEWRRKWRAVLEEVGHLPGWHVHDRSEATIIEEISKNILCRLSRDLLNISRVLVGIESRAEKMISSLSIGMDDVRFIGIYGMNGIGKTTLTEAVYEIIFRKFEASSFFPRVGEEARNRILVHLQNQLLSGILIHKDTTVLRTLQGITMTKNRLRTKKVLIILDEVDEEEQLKVLVGNLRGLGFGGRIIITSRDHDLLNKFVDTVYEVEGLNDMEALQLFSRKAFKRGHSEENYLKLSKDMVNYAQGIPLVLEDMGSILSSRTMDQWRKLRDRLKASTNAGILDIVVGSIDALGNLQKKMFLDIAYFFEEEHEDRLIRELKSFRYCPNLDIEFLAKKSLINTSTGRVLMHKMLQKMGQQIVHQESSKEIGKHNKLWYYEDFIHMLRNNTGIDAIEDIVLKLPLPKQEQLSFEVFSKMKKLRLLQIDNMDLKSIHNLGTLIWEGDLLKLKLIKKLSVLHWWGYPLRSLASGFQANNLVELVMWHSNIKQLWIGRKVFDKLKLIDLSYLQELVETPDLSEVPSVEELGLAQCVSLTKVHRSTGFLKLRQLDLVDCKRVRGLPNEIRLQSLELLDLSGRSSLNKLARIMGDMTSLKRLDLSMTLIKKLPVSIKRFSSLESPGKSGCSGLKKIPKSLSGMEYLKCFYADGSAVRELPPRIVSLKKLKVLNLRGCGCCGNRLVAPGSLLGLSSIRELDLSYCNPLDKALPSDLNCLYSLESLDLSGNKFKILVDLFSGLSSMRKLNLSSCNLLDRAITSDLYSLTSLRLLDLSGNRFTKIPDSVRLLSNLSELRLEDCTELKVLPKLPLGLGLLSLRNCPSLETFYNQVHLSSSSRILRTFDLSFVAAYIGYDGTPYKVLHLHPKSPSWINSKAQIFDTSVACGVALELGMPKWFNKKSSSSKGWKGYALYIDYQVHESPTYRRRGKMRKVPEHGNLNVRIFDGSNPTFPYFVCQFQFDKVCLGGPLVLCAPERPSVGRNGFWVYIPTEWFGKQDNNLERWTSIEASITTGHPNVKLNNYGWRPIHRHHFSDFYEVLSSISPSGLDGESWEKMFLWLHREMNALKVKGPIKGNVKLWQPS